MNSDRKWIAAILVVGLMAAGLTAAYFGIYFLAERIASLDKTVATVTILSLVAVVYSARVIAAAPQRAMDRAAIQRQEACRARAYFRLIKAWAKVLQRYSNVADGSTPPDRTLELMQAEQRLLLFGSTAVINYYFELQNRDLIQIRMDPSPLDHLLRQMRTESGQSNSKLDSAALCQLFQSTIPERFRPAPKR